MLSGKHTEVSKNRLAVFTSKDKSEVNLFSKIYPEKVPITNIRVHSIADKNHKPLFHEIIETVRKEAKEAKIGSVYGPSWSTHWFELKFEVPESFKGYEVHFIWDSESEALIYSEDGTPLQGLLGTAGDDRRDHYILLDPSKGGEKFTLYVELAGTAMFGNGFGNGWGGLGPNPTDVNKTFTLKQVDLGRFDRLAHELLYKFITLADMVKQFPEDSFRASQGLFTANTVMNKFYLEDRESWKECLQIVNGFLTQKNSDQAHNISAVGHCHIDTAWLWPYSETKRKCARSWASQIRIAERHPDYKFGCSQAQQFEWVKDMYPKLYSEMKTFVKKGQFVPIGATWVEMDCNIPSGESFVRQFLIGQRFFRSEFGQYCKEFWLPDTFGYSAQLPQIILNSGVDYFMTQKLSWCQFNKFPHHTFYWEGLDGSKVFTHFPPGDTYNSQTNVKDTLFHLKNFKEKERCNESLMVFGFGDGGGGPLMEMVENIKFIKDTDGMNAKIEMRSPHEFFQRAIKDAKDVPTWSGELYFEAHRGTYTSQANNKSGNRQGEFLLRNIEMLSSITASVKSDFSEKVYNQAHLTKLWKLLLLNQFHDVLPGSSINEVYRDSDEHYGIIQTEGKDLLGQALKLYTAGSGDSAIAWNTLGWPRQEVINLEAIGGKGYQIIDVPSIGHSTFKVSNIQNKEQVQVTRDEKAKSYTLQNKYVVAVLDDEGRLRSMILKAQNADEDDRESIAEGGYGNQFVMYEDVPMYWDAWDVDVYHLEKKKTVNTSSNTTVKIVEEGGMKGSIEITIQISSKSKIIQRVSLDCISKRLDFDTRVEWHETHQFLKVEFDLNIRSLFATYEVAYGHIQRPTHFNTSWDVARFEVCAHKWADLSESGFGVSLLNDSKYGYATHANTMRLSLLRSPKNPDPDCDMGNHHFKYALLPHRGTFQQANIIRESFNFNVPLLLSNTQSSAEEMKSYFSVNHPSVIIDTIKKAEDGNEVIVRFYESHGGRVSFKLSTSISFKKVRACNLLEEEQFHSTATSKNLSSDLTLRDGKLDLKIHPFQIVTLAFSC